MNDEHIDSHLESLPLFPLPGIVLFPNTLLPLHIFESRYRAMVEDAQNDDLPIVMAQLDPDAPPAGPGELPPVHPIAGVGRLRKVQEIEGGRYLIELRGVARIRILEEHPLQRPYRRVRAERLAQTIPEPGARTRVDVLRGMLLSMRQTHEFSRRMHALLTQSDCPHIISDVAAHLLTNDSELRQELLEELNPSVRLDRIIDSLSEFIAAESSVSAAN